VKLGGGSHVRVQDLLQKNSILIDFPPEDKNDVLTQMAQYLASLYGHKNPDLIVNGIFAREAELSTGIGLGIALPHARIDGVDRIRMVVARCSHEIDFGAIDDQSVRLVFMSVSPKNSAELTNILSVISKIMYHEEVRSGLLESPDVDTFLNVMVTGEDLYAGQ
jgi:PTS system nitrogen regulatory IIA component